ncbi:hypothetical protein L1987_31281 [Smallanthus sonchifolius]|uniref:Uncharacterized protein n=1 Tax=Smallanthus sonchifolius TaxID=185202 RepID=A0ACB9I5S5_9ASTR|nr:hypothetical protein L1987_31281 [Smallanthus sonchifolius]
MKTATTISVIVLLFSVMVSVVSTYKTKDDDISKPVEIQETKIRNLLQIKHLKSTERQPLSLQTNDSESQLTSYSKEC